MVAGETLSYLIKISSVIVLTGAIVPIVALSPSAGRQAIVVFAPWVDKSMMRKHVWNAGGHVVSFGRFGVIANSGHDGFFRNLRHNGAILIFDAARTSALCGDTAQKRP